MSASQRAAAGLFAGARIDLIGTDRARVRAVVHPRRSRGGPPISLAVALMAVISVAPVNPALADHDNGRDRGHEHGRGYERAHERYHEHRHYRVYAPPPVYYRREASPGVSLFLPFDLR